MRDRAEKPDIRGLGLDELTEALAERGEAAFRARQVYEWLWQRSCTSFDGMTNLSLELRRWLSDHFCLRPIELHQQQKSSDGTIKSAFRLYDGKLIEGVLIPTETRVTACISSQVGCALGCKFCATGYMGRVRDLDAAEIYDQVVLLNRQAESNYGMPLSNIVYMGMGEPLLNYRQVLRSAELISSPAGLGMSPRRLTVSTAGIAKMIRRLADDGVRFNLALSLHAADDEKRNTIMPINESNRLDILREALQYFHRQTDNEITLEYIAFDRFNDGIDDARKLLRFAASFPCKINIIEYNPIAEASFVKSGGSRLEAFTKWLEQKGMTVNLRRSRGKDIDAACGQLANKQTPGVPETEAH
jgi:23S rRNA (adenine2503-C2)-methyltransferase